MNKHGGYYGKNEKMIDFSVNINPFGTSEYIKKLLIDNINELHKYPEIDGFSTRKSIAEYLNLDNDNIILGNGAIELIYLFANIFSKKKVLVIQPTFNEYERAFKMFNCIFYNYINSENNGFVLDYECFAMEIKKINPDVVVICNPNNPTGIYTDYSLIEDICKKYSNTIWFIDESFIDFSLKNNGQHLIEKYNVFLLRSITKFFALPGLRAGYGIGNKVIIERMKKLKQPWTVNHLALQVLSSFFRDEKYINMTYNWIDKTRSEFYKKLTKLNNISVINSSSNFILCKHKNILASELNKILNNNNIYIRTCNDFIGLDKYYFRIAIKLKEENQIIIENLKTLK